MLHDYSNPITPSASEFTAEFKPPLKEGGVLQSSRIAPFGIKVLLDDNSLYSHCRNCPKETHCCYRAPTIVVLPNEAAKLIERTKRPDLFVPEEGGLYSIKKTTGSPCPFLTKDNLCGVYDIRPIDCRSWPLTLNLATETKGDLLEDADCPAVQNGALTARFVQAARKTLSKIPVLLRSFFVKLVHRDFDQKKIRVNVHIDS